MIAPSVTRKTRRTEALAIGEDFGIRPFFALYLCRLPRREAIELADRARFLYPTDRERRGERVREMCLAATRGA